MRPCTRPRGREGRGCSATRAPVEGPWCLNLQAEKLMSSRRLTRRYLRIAQQPPHRLDYPNIELASRFVPELLEGFGGRTLGPVALGPVGPAKHHVVGVHHRHYTRTQGYLISFEPVGVTASVRTLVVMPDHRECPREGLYRLDHPRSHLRVKFDDFPLFLRKGTQLLQDRVCHT